MAPDLFPAMNLSPSIILKVDEPLTCTRSDSVSDSPPKPSSYPWLVAYDTKCVKDTDQIFYDVHSNTHHHSRIPELAGKEIEACFHGWLILSDYTEKREYSLWDPETLTYIPLPPLISKSLPKDEFIFCCLSSPPPDPNSILLVFSTSEPIIFLCRVCDTRKEWSQVSYGNQIEKSRDRLCSPVCYNGKLYAITSFTKRLVRIDIVRATTSFVIQLVPWGHLPSSPLLLFCKDLCLAESCGELFAIYACRQDYDSSNLQSVHLFKLDFSTVTWEEITRARDRVFFLDSRGYGLFSCAATDSGFLQGNHVHIISDRNELYSYHLEAKTLSPSSLSCAYLSPKPLPSLYRLKWVMPRASGTKDRQRKEELELMPGGDGDGVLSEGEAAEGFLLKIPFHILQLIVERCGAIEYLKLRATCKYCRSAAPLPVPWAARWIWWVQSIASPWLMVFDKDVTTFSHPKFGEAFLMPTHPVLTGDAVIRSSGYGWLLVFKGQHSLMFLNPFTNDIIQLPDLMTFLFPHEFSSFGFSSPPTSPKCLVAGFTISDLESLYITSPERDNWYLIDISSDISYCPSHQSSQAFCIENLYVIYQSYGTASVLKHSPYRRRTEILAQDCLTDSPGGSKGLEFDNHYLVECNNKLLLVSMTRFGECIEVFKLNHGTGSWDIVRCLGNYMICIGDTASFSTIAKVPGMENKIYFPRLYGKNKDMVFYSLDTCCYHTFGLDKQEQVPDFFHTEKQLLSVWIEPDLQKSQKKKKGKTWFWTHL